MQRDLVKKTRVDDGIVPRVRFIDITTHVENSFTIQDWSTYSICADDREGVRYERYCLPCAGQADPAFEHRSNPFFVGFPPADSRRRIRHFFMDPLGCLYGECGLQELVTEPAI
jgi:hypothetical protein